MSRLLSALYNLDSHKCFADSVQHVWRDSRERFDGMFKDSTGGLVLPRSLQIVDPTIYEQQYPENTFLQTGMEINNTGGFGQRVTSLSTRPTGKFTRASDRADNKGRIAVDSSRSDINVVQLESGIQWTYSDLQTVALENRNLMDELLRAVNEIYNQEIDDAGYLGVDGQEGLLNFSGFVTTPAIGLIGTLTPLQMYTEIQRLITLQKNAVQGTAAYVATHVVMPYDVFTTLESTILDTTASNPASVLEALRRNFSYITFMYTKSRPSLANSATVAFSANRQSMQFRIPVPLTIGETKQPSSFTYAADCFYRIAGLDVLRNEAGYILTGL